MKDKIKDTILNNIKNRFMSKDKKSSETVHDEKGKHANSIIKNHIIWSMGAGFIPVPIADLFAVSAVQLDMIRQVANVYDIDFKETEGKALITAITGSSIARLGARAVKFIPGVGTALGGVTMSVLSGASTYALGEVFKKHFETGGTFLDFDPKRVKKFYDEKFEKGKKVAKDLKKKQGEKEDTTTTDENLTKSDKIQQSLKDLVNLKAEGLISQEEYEKLKKKILEKI